MAVLWDVATPEERREMVILLLEPGGLYYDLEQKIIAALKPRPAFLPILRMLNGIVEYDEARGLFLVERWQDRNRRASAYLQVYQRDRQTRPSSSSFQRTAVFLFCSGDWPSRPSRNTQAATRQLNQLCSSSASANSSSSNSSSYSGSIRG